MLGQYYLQVIWSQFLSINVLKGQFGDMYFHVKNMRNQLKHENVKVASYLGVQISRDLPWHIHVAKVSAKGNKLLRFITCNIRTSSKATKSLAYQTLVRPSLEYTSCVSAPHLKHLHEAIDKIQRRSASYVCDIWAKGSCQKYADSTWMGHPWAVALKICCYYGL